MDIAVGDGSWSSCDQKSSYKQVSDFERLRSYDRLKLRKHLRIIEKTWNKNNKHSAW
jgi:hypothetical protein